MSLSPSTKRRHDNIRVLLRTLNDIYPGPTTLKTNPGSGPAPGRRVPCDFCHRSGKAYSPSLQRITPCPVCDGRKWRTRRAGEPEWDEMTGQPVATSETRKPEPMSPQRLDSELQRVELDLRLRAGDTDPNEAYSWERAREARDKGTSYTELERVLGVMQIEEPIARSAINWIYFADVGASLPECDESALIEWISARMRGKVRVPRAFFEAQQAETRAEAKRLLKEGSSDLEVARSLGISRETVRQCVSSVSAGIIPVVTPRGQDVDEPLHGLKRDDGAVERVIP